MAPNVTISPWAKLVRPVVPKMSDSPTAHMASIRPKRAPSATRWASCDHQPTLDRPALPVKKLTVTVEVTNDPSDTWRSAPPSLMPSPSGSVDSSSVTV